MNLESFKVNGLFGRFDYELKFKRDERIMIMIGPNGSGKTMILRMIDYLFNKPPLRLGSLPFSKMEVAFGDGSAIAAEKVHPEEKQEEEEAESLELTFRTHGGRQEVFPVLLHVGPEHLNFSVNVIENRIAGLDQIDSRLWRARRTGRILSLGDVIAQYGDELPQNFDETLLKVPEWLQSVRRSMAVKFIGTERLNHSLRRRIRPSQQLRTQSISEHSEGPLRRAVSLYSTELARRVQQTLAEYGSLSQSLDRTFPGRILEGPENSDYPVEHLIKDLDEIEHKRSDLVEAGLIAQEEKPIAILEPFSGGDPRLPVLAVHAQDAKEKLSVFDDLHKRVRAFRSIANSRFLHKRVMVGLDGLNVLDSDDSELELEMLSSGEQHELVILYELLFRTSDLSLILIDEPELSLHVQWQTQFLKDIEEMANVSNFRAILATHSPEIIGERWDLTAELKGLGRE